jgi:sugar phosphate permease
LSLSTAPHVPSAADRRLARFRLRIFASTWLSYAGFYFCRHAFYVLKPELTRDLGIDAAALGDIGVVYLVAYTIGQFVSAAVGDRTGPRALLLGGMALSALANVAFGFANNVWTFAAFMALNGLSQATGWSGNIGTMARWFRRRERGTVMGLWATCYQVGGALAKGFAAFVLGIAGWRWSFWGASLVLAGVWLVFLLLQRNRPEDAGLPPLDDPDEREPGAGGDAAAEGAADEGAGWTRQLVLTVAIAGVAYFFIKFIRYTLWSWGTYFLNLNFGMETEEAGYVSAVFDIAGFVGVIVAGIVSDRLFRGRRTQTALILLLGLVGATGVLWAAGGQSLTVFVVSFGLIGFMLYGPDSLLSGAGAMDAGSRRHALAAAGIINGLGSIGSVAQEPVIGWLYGAGVHGLDPAGTVALDQVAALSGQLALGAGGLPAGAILPTVAAHAGAAAYGPALLDLQPILVALGVSAVGAAAAAFYLWWLARTGRSRL